MMRATRLILASALAASLLFSACTAASPEPPPMTDDPPSTSATPRPSPSATPTPSPSATPPSLPPEAEGTSPAAAKAFARHYFHAINYAAATGDTEGLRALGTRNCVSCDAIASNIEKVYDAGGRIAQEDWQIRTARVLQATNGTAVIAVGSSIAPEVIIRADGTRKRTAGGKQPMTMFLAQAPSGSKVTKLDLAT